jgi:hypothetical protein
MKDNPTVTVIKAWIFPGLVSLVSMMIWNDVNEIKADVKALMAQSNIDKTRIDNLERNVYKTVTKHPDENPPLILARLEGILPTNKEIDED